MEIKVIGRTIKLSHWKVMCIIRPLILSLLQSVLLDSKAGCIVLNCPIHLPFILFSFFLSFSFISPTLIHFSHPHSFSPTLIFLKLVVSIWLNFKILISYLKIHKKKKFAYTHVFLSVFRERNESRIDLFS